MSEQFKTKKQIYKALIDGLTITNGKGYWKVKLSSDDLLYGKYGNDREWTLQDFNFNNVTDWSIYEEPKWYDNIPECGVLCWCSSKANAPTPRLLRVVEYMNGHSYCFHTDSGGCFPEATPLTKGEVMQYIWNGDE